VALQKRVDLGVDEVWVRDRSHVADCALRRAEGPAVQQLHADPAHAGRDLEALARFGSASPNG